MKNSLARDPYSKELITKANNCIVADTSGFHYRGEAVNINIRSALHGAICVEVAFDA